VATASNREAAPENVKASIRPSSANTAASAGRFPWRGLQHHARLRAAEATADFCSKQHGEQQADDAERSHQNEFHAVLR
jgi:hypothetical protein